MQGLCTIMQHDKKCQLAPNRRKCASKALPNHVLTMGALTAAGVLGFGRASANSFSKKRGHTQYEFDPLLSVLPNPRPTLPFQRRQHPRQLFLTSCLSPLSDRGPRNGATFLCAWDDAARRTPAGVSDAAKHAYSRIRECSAVRLVQLAEQADWALE